MGKGKTLEQVTPMFRFKNCSEFRNFVRGNLRTGDGMVSANIPHKEADIQRQVEATQVDDEQVQRTVVEKHVNVESTGDIAQGHSMPREQGKVSKSRTDSHAPAESRGLTRSPEMEVEPHKMA